MLISYHWLKKFVDLRQLPQEIADKITLNLVEVEPIQKRGDDFILEIENKGITNRPDCFSQLGVAREVAAYFGLLFKNPLPRLQKIKHPKPAKPKPLRLEVKESRLCPRYTTMVLTDIKVGPSPKWLRVGVENCGVRSINNVVDITNYVMLELGQPLHAFDYDKVEGQKIVVRKAKRGERLITFEGDKINLLPSTLVIADTQKPLAMAGIIGGRKAEITSQTETIILESANFNKVNNRKSEKDLKIRTEASTRFEKGLDVNLTLPALNRAVELLKKVAGAKVASGLLDAKANFVRPKEIKTSPDWINNFLGLELKSQEIVAILARLQLKCQLKERSLVVTIPSFRSDLNLPADIAEEVARIYGYDNIPITLPETPAFVPKENPGLKLRKKTKQFLASLGFSEALAAPFVGEELLKDFGLDPRDHLRLVNPLTVEQEFMRQTLVPNLVLAVAKNLKNFEKIKIFEIGKVFLPQKKKLPKEIPTLTMAVVKKDSFLVLKGAIEWLLATLGVKALFKPSGKFKFWQEGQTAVVVTPSGQTIGRVGKIKRNVLLKIGVKKDASFAELDFSDLLKLAKPAKTYEPIFQYPPIIEDLSLVVPAKTYVGPMIQSIKQVSSMIQRVELTSSYKNTRTFRLTYQSQKKTLTDKEVRKIRGQIIKNVGKKFEARIKQKKVSNP